MSRFVAIVGRPNVGKSTLFNRLAGERRAIVEDLPGVTRDRLYARTSHEGFALDLIDTGGFDPNPEGALLQVMKRQVELAIEEADAIIFLMDAKEGLNPVDGEIYRMLAGRGKPLFPAVNKVDSPEKEGESYGFYTLGMDHLYLLSATHGRGVGTLMDDVRTALRELPEPPEPPAGATRVAVMGRPNVGKSTIINRLLGQERLLTSDMPGTTRDSIDVCLTTPEGDHFLLVDTAGMRRRRAIRDQIEHYSVLRAILAMERAEVVLILLDSRVGMEDQDVRIASLAEERGRGLLFLFNKWDLIQREEKTAQSFVKALHEHFPTFAHVPVLFTSALTGRGVLKVLKAAREVKEQWERRIPTAELNRFLEEAMARNPPPIHRGRPGKILFATQAETGPPTFIFQVNKVEAFTANYRRYLHNRLRESYGFKGTPLRLFFRGRAPREASE